MNTLEWSLARIAELEKELAKVVKELEQIREENKDLKAILEERVSAPRIIFRKTIHKSDDEKKNLEDLKAMKVLQDQCLRKSMR